MRFLERPAFWVVVLAAVFAFTIGGPTFSTLGPLMVDNPSQDEFLLEDRQSAPQAGDDEALANMGRGELLESGEDVTIARGVEPGDPSATADPAGEEAEGVGGPTEEEAASVGPARPQVLIHHVQPGETLSQIAAHYGIAPETIQAANDLPNANVLQVGQRLNILSVDGALHKVKRGESLWEISRTYRTDMDLIVSVNDLQNPSRLRPEQELVIPGSEAAEIGSTIRSEQLVSSSGQLLRAFSWPVRGRISSRFGPRWGRMHHGVDIAVNTGTPVRAAARGRVTFSGRNGGYGNLVVIDHGNGVETRYAHNSRLVVRVGEYVKRGAVIAYSGNTGNSTGPHVHFEIRLRGRSVNPLNYL